MDHLRRLGGFVLLPAMSMLASLTLLPVISHNFGASGWVTLALGQSIGAVISVVVSLAWPVIGGHRVATASRLEERRDIYSRSISSRLVMLIILLPVAIPVTFLLTGEYRLEATLFMISISLNGLTASWYFAGTGEPRHVVVNEGVVRLVSYIVALVGLLLGAELIWYAGVVAIAGAVMSLLNWRTVMGSESFFRHWSIRQAFQTIREQLSGTMSRVLQALFGFGGPAIFSAVAPTGLAVFSGVDQVQKAANNALGVVPLAFISWVGSAAPEDRRRRIVRSMLVVVAIGAIATVLWLLLGPFVLSFLFSGGLTAPPAAQLALILLIVALLVLRSVELLVMIPLGFEQTVYTANSVASVVGIAALALGGLLFGVLGGLVATLAVNALLIIFYLIVLVRRRRRGIVIQIEA